LAEGELDKRGTTAAARCLADDLDALVLHLRYPPRHRRRWREHKPARTIARRGEEANQGSDCVLELREPRVIAL
jgi:hypothetical protein